MVGMRRHGRVALLGTVMVLGLLVPAASALACDWAPLTSVEDVQPGEPLPEFDPRTSVVHGVYELEHIAASPDVIIVDERTVSVVTRYWGTAPPDTGFAIAASVPLRPRKKFVSLYTPSETNVAVVNATISPVPGVNPALPYRPPL